MEFNVQTQTKFLFLQTKIQYLILVKKGMIEIKIIVKNQGK